MIYVYHQKMKGVWYGAAVQDGKVLATSFSFEEQDLGRLLRRYPLIFRFGLQRNLISS